MSPLGVPFTCFFFFFNDTATTEIYTLSLHDALPISDLPGARRGQPHATHVVARRGGDAYGGVPGGPTGGLDRRGDPAAARGDGRRHDLAGVSLGSEIGRASCRERV